VILVMAACGDEPPTGPEPPTAPAASVAPATPAPLAGLDFGALHATVWPFTGRNFVDAADPINLAFVGNVKPVQLRAALLALDGNRGAFGFPPVAPFDCVWTDAIGDVQSAYSDNRGWTGSAIQLACGGYGPIRFHVRFFEAGEWTLAGAHFEVLIPGTAEHEVLSWELAEQLVVADFLRTGLLDTGVPLAQSQMITPVPSYRAINPFVYNGLPTSLTSLLGTGDGPVKAPVPIPNNGIATILNVAGTVPITPGVAEQTFEITYNQIVPRPFCATGPADLILVSGPVRLTQTVRLTGSGQYVADSRITGILQVTPQAAGAAVQNAKIFRRTHASITDAGTMVESRFRQAVMPEAEQQRQTFHELLRIGPGQDRYELNVRCD
jgi:hypothetical protein